MDAEISFVNNPTLLTVCGAPNCFVALTKLSTGPAEQGGPGGPWRIQTLKMGLLPTGFWQNFRKCWFNKLVIFAFTVDGTWPPKTWPTLPTQDLEYSAALGLCGLLSYFDRPF